MARLAFVWPVLIFLGALVIIDELLAFLFMYLEQISPIFGIFGGFSFLKWLIDIIRGLIELAFAILHLVFMVPAVPFGIISFEEIMTAGADIIIILIQLIGIIIDPLVDNVLDMFIDFLCAVIPALGITKALIEFIFPGTTDEEIEETARIIVSRGH